MNPGSLSNVCEKHSIPLAQTGTSHYLRAPVKVGTHRLPEAEAHHFS